METKGNGPPDKTTETGKLNTSESNSKNSLSFLKNIRKHIGPFFKTPNEKDAEEKSAQKFILSGEEERRFFHLADLTDHYLKPNLTSSLPEYQPEEVRETLRELKASKELLKKSINSGSTTYGLLSWSLKISDDFLVYLKDSNQFSATDHNDPITTDIKDLLDFVTDLLSKNLNKLEKIADKEVSFLSSMEIWKTMIDLAEITPKKQVKKDIARFFARNFEHIIRSEKDRGDHNPRNLEELAENVPMLNLIFESAEYSEIEKIKQLAGRLLKDDDENIRRAVCSLLFSGKTVHIDKINDITSSTFGVSINNIHDFEPKAMSEIVYTVSSLEKERPCISSVLQSEFGISWFARYPEELLIEQYDKRGIKDLPYGIIIYPQADYNQAFYSEFSNRNIFERLGDQLKGKYEIKIFEAKNSLELVHALNKSRKEYGKISFAIIGGHGSKDSIVLGNSVFNPERKQGVLDQAHVANKGASSLQLAFIENPTIILVSCSTGELGGIGPMPCSP